MNNKQQQAYQGDTTTPYCCFHPREIVVGVCAHCLKDRLLLLLLHADAPLHRRSRSRSRSGISLPKVLALGSSFLQRLDSRHHRHDAAAPSYSDSDGTASASPDDSFISIKFEDNGKATWDSVATKAAPAPAPVRSSTVVVSAEHAKRGGVTRWRKQVVGRLLQLARWKRSAASKAAACQHHAGQKAAERSKARGRSAGWIRSIALTRRRAADRPCSS